MTTFDSTVTWTDGMAFDAALDGHTFAIDAAETVGGHNLGPRPKGLLLTALAGCTAMDVISILRKMRVDPRSFSVHSTGTLAPDHPRRFVRITTTYALEGDDIPAAKVRRAVELSETRYCGVRATLEPAVEFATEVLINGERVD